MKKIYFLFVLFALSVSCSKTIVKKSIDNISFIPQNSIVVLNIKSIESFISNFKENIINLHDIKDIENSLELKLVNNQDYEKIGLDTKRNFGFAVLKNKEILSYIPFKDKTKVLNYIKKVLKKEEFKYFTLEDKKEFSIIKAFNTYSYILSKNNYLVILYSGKKIKEPYKLINEVPMIESKHFKKISHKFNDGISLFSTFNKDIGLFIDKIIKYNKYVFASIKFDTNNLNMNLNFKLDSKSRFSKYINSLNVDNSSLMTLNKPLLLLSFSIDSELISKIFPSRLKKQINKSSNINFDKEFLNELSGSNSISIYRKNNDTKLDSFYKSLSIIISLGIKNDKKINLFLDKITNNLNNNYLKLIKKQSIYKIETNYYDLYLTIKNKKLIISTQQKILKKIINNENTKTNIKKNTIFYISFIETLKLIDNLKIYNKINIVKNLKPLKQYNNFIINFNKFGTEINLNISIDSNVKKLFFNSIKDIEEFKLILYLLFMI